MFISKIKIVTASYFETENHGSGKKYGISPSKPNGSDCDLKFEYLSPEELFWEYRANKSNENAGKIFVEKFKEKLDNFKKDVLKSAKEENKTVFELLPFESGDTLLSWENKGNLTYRRLVAQTLRDLGYEVIEN